MKDEQKDAQTMFSDFMLPSDYGPIQEAPQSRWFDTLALPWELFLATPPHTIWPTTGSYKLSLHTYSRISWTTEWTEQLHEARLHMDFVKKSLKITLSSS